MNEAFDRLRERARINAIIRAFFGARDLLEVTTPVLSRAGNTDINIESFSTAYSGPTIGGPLPRWLRTSPEFALKRLLAAGCGDVFEIGPVFRNGEFGPRHNPEFCMLEWYRTGFDHHQLMDEVAALVTVMAAAFGRPIAAVGRISYRDFYLQHLSLDPFSATIDALAEPLAGFGITAHGLNRDDWLDLLRTHCIEPRLPAQGALLIYDFPASQAALAKLRLGDPIVAERFELYLGGLELANGYHELTDAADQRARFEHDLAVRRERGSTLPEIDQALLAALPSMPACSGVALGIERLHQWLIGAHSLDSVMPFRFDRA